MLKGFSEEAVTEVESTNPQVSRDSVIFVAQVLALMASTPGFCDFTQAFHSWGMRSKESCTVFNQSKEFQEPIHVNSEDS